MEQPKTLSTNEVWFPKLMRSNQSFVELLMDFYLKEAFKKNVEIVVEEDDDNWTYIDELTGEL